MSVHIGGPGAVGNLNPLFQPTNAQPKPAADYKASNGILSGSELIAQMGGPPKSDVTILGQTLKTHSAEYKEALGHLTTYQTALDGTKGRGLEGVPPHVVAVLKDELQGVIDAADAYSAKHAGADGKADRRGVMASLRDMATTEMANLDKLDTLINTAGKKVDVPSGLALLRGGVTDCTEFSATMNDDAIDKGASKDNFGSGKANTVSLLSYGGDMRVVKPINKTADKLMAGESTTGFDKDDMRTAARNTASSNVAEQLGIGSMIPKAAIVVHNGQAGLAMPLAKGESLIHKHEVPVTNPADVKRYDTEWNAGFFDNFKNYGVRKDDNGVWQKTTAGFKEIPYTGGGNPALTATLQKNLLDLQVCDCLMGQMDRQPENIFIQISGNKSNVTGIDNDMCMGRLLTTLDAPREDLKSTYGGPPPLMSREMHDKLQAMTADSLKASLGPEFTPAELSAATQRLTLLQAHATKLETAGLVVDNFQTWTGPDKAGKQVGVGEYLVGADLRSYVQRDAKTLSKAQPVPLDANKHV